MSDNESASNTERLSLISARSTSGIKTNGPLRPYRLAIIIQSLLRYRELDSTKNIVSARATAAQKKSSEHRIPASRILYSNDNPWSIFAEPAHVCEFQFL